MSVYTKFFSAAAAGLAFAWLASGLVAQEEQAPPVDSDFQTQSQDDARQDEANQENQDDSARENQSAGQDSQPDEGRSQQNADDRNTSTFEDRGPINEQSRQGQFGQEQQQSRQGQFVQSDTPPVPEQARSGQSADADPDADWRMNYHNNEWWFYTSDGNWMYHRDGDWQPYEEGNFRRMSQQDAQQFGVVENRQQQLDQTAQYDQQRQQQQSQQLNASDGEHTAAYRGAQQNEQAQDYADDSGRQQAQNRSSDSAAAPLFFDQCGRPYICENGRRLYVQLQSEQPHSVAYRGMNDQPQAGYSGQQDARVAERQQSGSYNQQGMIQQQDQYRSAQRQAPPIVDDRGAQDRSSNMDRRGETPMSTDEPDSASNRGDDNRSSNAGSETDSDAADNEQNRENDSEDGNREAEGADGESDDQANTESEEI